VNPEPRSNSAARQRLIVTADRLFYQHGIRSVGIDRVIAEAGVAKMTLYAHFRSKDDLILAVLQYREAQVSEFFQASVERHRGSGADPLSAFFRALREWFETPGFRGCAFQNAVAELADPTHPGHTFVRDHKQRFQGFLSALVEAAAPSGATGCVPAIALLVEGAIMMAMVHGTSDAAEVAREAAMRLLHPGGFLEHKPPTAPSGNLGLREEDL
jgi:AcrR family transcriptional regulator